MLKMSPVNGSRKAKIHVMKKCLVADPYFLLDAVLFMLHTIVIAFINFSSWPSSCLR